MNGVKVLWIGVNSTLSVFQSSIRSSIQDSICSPFQRKKEKETKFVLKFEKLKIERIED